MACRSSRAVSGVTPHGAMSRQAVLSWPSSATGMSARRMNSNRRRPGPRISDLDAEPGADGAVGPVSADEPPRPDLRDLGGLCGDRELYGHPLVVLRQGLKGPPAVKCYP